MKIALYYRYIDDADLTAFDTLRQALASRNIDCVIVGDGDSVDGCDYLFSVGGDGTLLSSVQFVHSSNPCSFPPILGINFGHLGFLTTVGKENLAAVVDDLLEGRFSLEKRTLLQVTDPSADTVTYALNEVFLHRPEGSSMLRTQVYVDGDYVATYAGDGLIVATPTGSTAYSLSCGGPILTPNSGCFVITPIAVHNLTVRPIIVPDGAALRLLTHPSSQSFNLSADSQKRHLAGGIEISLSRAPFTIRLVRLHRQTFFTAIHQKLGWNF